MKKSNEHELNLFGSVFKHKNFITPIIHCFRTHNDYIFEISTNSDSSLWGCTGLHKTTKEQVGKCFDTYQECIDYINTFN